jgi:RimJ/RimL family protein N-acetyltransferase
MSRRAGIGPASAAEESVVLVGDGVVLRDWRPADVAAYQEWLRPEHEWHQTNGPYYGTPSETEVDQIAARLERVAGADVALRPVPRQSLVIPDPDAADPATGSLVGVASWYWESEPTDWRRMGLVIVDPAYWGKGLGTRALRLWTTYLFETTDARRLDFATYSGNQAMLAIGRKLGFVEEGRFRKARPWRGVDYDSVVYGVLREEWSG